MMNFMFYKKMKEPVVNASGVSITNVCIGIYGENQMTTEQADKILADFNKNPEPTVVDYYWILAEKV